VTAAGTVRPRIYLDHGEAYGNLGDDAMLLNAVRRIGQHIGPCSFVLPVKPGCPVPEIEDCTVIRSPGFRPQGRILWRLTPDAVWRLAGEAMVRSVRAGRDWHRAIVELRACDALYCVGAANMNEWTRRGPLLMKWALIKTARRLGKPVIVSSQTIGPFRSRWTLEKTVEAVRLADHFSFRDRRVSLDILKGAGVDTAGLPEVGDEAFSLPPAGAERARAWLAAAGVDPARSFGLIHFRATDYTRRTVDLYPKLAAALDRLPTHAQLAFLPMSRGFHSPPDAKCAENIRTRMVRPERLFVLECPTDPGLARRLVAMARWVVALSYHVQVFALAEATPTLLLVSGDYYRQKAAGLNGWTERRTPVADLDTVSAEDLCDRITGLEQDRRGHVAVLREAAAKVAAVNDLPVEALAEPLGCGQRREERAE